MFVISDPVSHDPLLLKILDILVHASEILVQEFDTYASGKVFKIDRKEDTSPVTQADLRVNQYMTEELAKLEPFYPVLSEESESVQRSEWKSFWMLDPLDGTKEFLHKRPEFTINLSLVCGDKTNFSALVVPCKGVVYLGYLDQHPYKYEFQSKRWWRYQADSDQHSNVIRVGLSHNNKNDQYQQLMTYLEQYYTVERLEAGSAYKFCLMLEGEIDLYPRFHPTSEWDTSAGQGLLESIGGGLVSLKGLPFKYNVRDTLLNKGFLAFASPKYEKLAKDLLSHMDNYN